jgi:hypothetical protein
MSSLYKYLDRDKNGKFSTKLLANREYIIRQLSKKSLTNIHEWNVRNCVAILQFETGIIPISGNDVDKLITILSSEDALRAICATPSDSSIEFKELLEDEYHVLDVLLSTRCVAQINYDYDKQLIKCSVTGSAIDFYLKLHELNVPEITKYVLVVDTFMKIDQVVEEGGDGLVLP